VKGDLTRTVAVFVAMFVWEQYLSEFSVWCVYIESLKKVREAMPISALPEKFTS